MARRGSSSFLGIDLAWGERNPSGLAALAFDGRRRKLSLLDHDQLTTDGDILAWVKEHAAATAVIGIDAPIIAPNAAGVGRPCDGLVTSAFGKFHAGTYPANRVKCVRPLRFRQKLEDLGFDPDPCFPPRSSGRRQLEVFPHPAQVVFFKLPCILKYKKGTLHDRKKGLVELVGHMTRCLPRSTPSLALHPALLSLRDALADARGGKALKAVEDKLDAIVCAYVAAYYWFWGDARCRVFGDLRTGYIVVPRPGRRFSNRKARAGKLR